MPRILVFAGSIRIGAYSGRTADAAQRELALQGAEVTRLSLGDYPMPILDQDLEKESGVPENALKLARQFAAHDGLLIATPEYNGSIPPLLKNAVDWVSRVRQDGGRPFQPMAGKPVALCSSSSGRFAGIRCIAHLRTVLVRCRMDVITPECSVPIGSEAFTDMGELRDEGLRRSMETVATTLIERARLLSTRIEP
ncbi:MAG: NAD(P)H-dependent oxidoreductase [Mesorhizobium sp.]